jgi:hypothetical protein
MAYILNKTDGTALVTVADNATTGSNYSVTFIGKNYLAYGEALNESLLHLLENSASTSANRPVTPVVGQTWYNKTDGSLYVCSQERVGATAAQFKALAKSSYSSTAPANPTVGDIWFDVINGFLKLYTGSTSGWTVIGPSSANWAQTTASAPDYIKNKPTTFPAALTIQTGGAVVSETPQTINFTGAGVTTTLVSGSTTSVVVNIPGGGGGVSLPAGATGYLYNNGNNTLSWSPVSTSTALSSLTDVDTAGLAVGNVLKYTTVSGVSKWRPAAGAAASTSFTLATSNGSARSMGVVLTPGTWQVILDTRLTTIDDFNQDIDLTQSATVGSVTVTTRIRTNRGGGSGHGRQGLGSSDIAVGEFTITVETPVNMSMAAAVPGDARLQSPVGSTLTVSKIAATDAQNLYGGTAPMFTFNGVGVGQTWQNVKSNRAVDISYTNSTGAPIMIALSFYLQHDRTLSVYVDNVMVLSSGSPADDSYHNLTFIVPNSSAYKVTKNGGTIDIWAELR